MIGEICVSCASIMQDIDFECSCSIDGDYVVIGSKNDGNYVVNSSSGYILKCNGEDCVEQAKLVSSNSNLGDLFGHSVSNAGNVNGDSYDDIITIIQDEFELELPVGEFQGMMYRHRYCRGTW